MPGDPLLQHSHPKETTIIALSRYCFSFTTVSSVEFNVVFEYHKTLLRQLDVCRNQEKDQDSEDMKLLIKWSLLRVVFGL